MILLHCLKMLLQTGGGTLYIHAGRVFVNSVIQNTCIRKQIRHAETRRINALLSFSSDEDCSDRYSNTN